MSETVKPCPWCPTLPEWRRDGLDWPLLIRCELHTVWMSLDRWNRRAAPDGAKGCGCDEPEAPPEPPAAHRFRPWDNDKCRDRCGDCGHLLSCLCHSSRKEEGK
jgi:hypothetical protein